MTPVLSYRHARRRAFTLLEVCLVMFVIILIAGAAIPNLAQVSELSAQEESFLAFDRLAQEARRRALHEEHSYLILWEEEGIALRREGDEGEEPIAFFPFEEKKKERPVVTLPAAMWKDPAPIWTFWPGGICEPATVTLAAKGRGWSAVYNPFSAQPTVTYETP